MISKFQAKRRRSNKKDDIELMYDYAGQIFCEMLGQTCYPEFYENNQMNYQEVFFSPSLFPPENNTESGVVLGIRYSWQSFVNNYLLCAPP